MPSRRQATLTGHRPRGVRAASRYRAETKAIMVPRPLLDPLREGRPRAVRCPAFQAVLLWGGRLKAGAPNGSPSPDPGTISQEWQE